MRYAEPGPMGTVDNARKDPPMDKIMDSLICPCFKPGLHQADHNFTPRLNKSKERELSTVSTGQINRGE